MEDGQQVTHKHGEAETNMAVKALGGRESSEPMRFINFQKSSGFLLLPSVWIAYHIVLRHDMGQTTRRWDRVAELGSTLQVLQPLLRTGRDKEDHLGRFGLRLPGYDETDYEQNGSKWHHAAVCTEPLLVDV